MTYDHWKATNPEDANADPREFEHEDPNPPPCEGCRKGDTGWCEAKDCKQWAAWEREELRLANEYRSGR